MKQHEIKRRRSAVRKAMIQSTPAEDVATDLAKHGLKVSPRMIEDDRRAMLADATAWIRETAEGGFLVTLQEMLQRWESEITRLSDLYSEACQAGAIRDAAGTLVALTKARSAYLEAFVALFGNQIQVPTAPRKAAPAEPTEPAPPEIWERIPGVDMEFLQKAERQIAAQEPQDISALAPRI